MKLDWLKLNIKKFAGTCILWFIAVVLHNVINILFGIEEAIFFILAVFVIPLYMLISLIYTAIIKIKQKK